MIQVIIIETIMSTFIHGLCSFLFNPSLCLSICSVTCIAEVAKVERTQNFECVSIFKATVNQVVISLVDIFLSFSVFLLVQMQISL